MEIVTFYDLLGVATDADAANLWPRSRIKSTTGFSIDANPLDLVKYLQRSLEFRAIHPGASNGRVGLSAEVIINNQPPIRPLVLTQMPDIEFSLQNIPVDKPARLYVTRAGTGVELVIEGLPVEIKLPSGLLGPLRTEAEEKAHPGGGPDDTQTDPFQKGEYDSLQVTLRDTGKSSIFVHLRVRMTEEMDFIIEPAVPISIGPCRFSGLPCHGLHDLNFVPSPRLQGDHSEGEQTLEWTRHPIDRFSADATYTGILTVRTVDLDNARTPLKELSEKLNEGRSSNDPIEFVLEDIALPFFNITALPVPSHGLFGLRRMIKFGDKPKEAFALSSAPAQFQLGDWRLLIEEFLLKTPASLKPLDQFIFVKMALLRGKDPDASYAGTVAFTDEWVFQIGLHLPKPGLELFKIGDSTVTLWNVKVGFSIKRALDGNHEYNFGEMFQVLGDLVLSTKATTVDTPLPIIRSTFQMRSLSGKDLEIAIRDLGWNLGEFSFGSLSFPEGVQFIFGDVVRLIVEEMGWVTENNGGRYFSFSGGISVFPSAGKPNRNPSIGAGSAALSEEKGKGGGIRFRRLRFWVGGNPNAPGWLLDGISILLKLGIFEISGFGMVSQNTLEGHNYDEFGFGIRVKFPAIGKKFDIGMQLFYGRVTGPNDNFTYWLFGFQFSPIPVGTFDLVNIRMLLAGNMVPNLPAPDGYEQNMRLFRWYKSSGNEAIALPDNRKLAKWIQKDDAFAAGLGAGVCLPVGKIITLDMFLFFHKSPEESGLLIALEAYIGKPPKPVGYGAFEYDFTRDKWGFTIGVTAGLEHVLGTRIPILSKLLSLNLTAILYAGNKPATFSIGQLNDQSTWASLHFKAKMVIIEAEVFVGFCIQLVDQPGGPRGIGLLVSAKGGAPYGIGKIQAYVSLGLMVGTWGNESEVSGFVIWFDAGLRIKVFWIFTFGASVKIEFDYLGPNPTYRRLGCEVRIETPWFLPDVTFRFEKIWDEPKLEQMAAISTPLISAGALNPGMQTQEDAIVTPLTGSAVDEKRVYNMDELRALGEPSVPPDAHNNLTSVAVDTTIALNFKPAVDACDPAVEKTPDGAGTQKATPSPPIKNDLSATYKLESIAIRRCPRFGPDAGVWTDLLEALETPLESLADLLPGSMLIARFTPTVSFQWDKDVLSEGRQDSRRLLINASTPYTFLTSNLEADESLARHEPGWPCCTRDYEENKQWHVLNFEDTLFGVRAPSYQKFSESSSTLHWIGSKPPVVVPGLAATAGLHAARVHLVGRSEGVFATISFDQPVFVCQIYAYWLPVYLKTELVVEVYNGLQQVDRQVFTLSNANPPAPIHLEAHNGMTSVILRFTGSFKPVDLKHTVAIIPRYDWIAFTQMRYRGLREELDRKARKLKCKTQSKQILKGGGKLSWLPNHNYEISLTTRVILDHTKTGSQEASIKQKAYFRTKGLPGLNAVARIGDELEPYVESSYPGLAPNILYRSEPVVLAFNEKFNILLPVDRAPSPDNPLERNQLLEWVLAVEKVGSTAGGERVSQTSSDWVVAHRTIPLQPVVRMARVIDSTVVYPFIRKAVTFDLFQKRFEALLHSPTGCNVPGPSLHRSQVLFHKPIDPNLGAGDPQYWEPNTAYRVNVRRKDGPFIERNPFDDFDYTAFDVANEGGSAGSSWSSKGGVMHVLGSPSDGVRRYAVFGECDWNHIQIHTTLDPEGEIAGAAVGVAGLPSVAHAVMALVDDKARQLRIIECRNGTHTQLANKPLPSEAKAPYALEVIAFDDQLRASVGKTAIEVNRDKIREGRLALVAENGGAFTSLIVEPLDAYRFYFQSSRFINFEEHIGSFDGEVITINVDAVSPNAATETVASLLGATGFEIAAVMTTGSDPEKRQRLFDRWVSGLALPLRSSLSRLGLSRLIRANGTDLFLLESPEPLPFSNDVTLRLKKRILVPTPKPLFTDDYIDFSKLAIALDFWEDRVRGPVDSDNLARKLVAVRRLVRATKKGDSLEYYIYDVKLRTNRQGHTQLSGELVEVICPHKRDGYTKTPAIAALSGLKANKIALLDKNLALIGPHITTNFTEKYIPVPFRVLTNGSETHALIIPVDMATNTLTPLKNGTYRFEFRLNRSRFRSQVASSVSNYRAEETIVTRW